MDVMNGNQNAGQEEIQEQGLQEQEAESQDVALQEGMPQEIESQDNNSKFVLGVKGKGNDDLETVFNLEEQKTVIVGADPECDVSVDDSFVSGKHFSVKLLSNGELEVLDLGARNGTFLKIEKPATVVLGDVLSAGKTLFTFKERAGDDQK